jgi:FkbM family methyltransferase
MLKFLYSIYARSSDSSRRIIVRIMGPIRLLSRPLIRHVSLGGYRMYLDRSDNAAFTYYFFGDHYESVLIEACLRLASTNPGCSFLDLGANHGAYTLALANIGRYGLIQKIYAFEPDKQCYNALSRSVSHNRFQDLVEAANLAVGDYVGEADFFASARASSSNRTFRSSTENLVFSRVENIACTTIDDFLEARGRRNGRFIVKIDIEGNELRSIKGMRRLLKQSEGFALIFEYSPLSFREVGLDFEEWKWVFDEMQLDYAFARTEGGLRRLDLPDGLLAAMEGMADSGGNFVIGRGLCCGGLSELVVPREHSHLPLSRK